MDVPEPAAIFDLDRTLLRGASGPIINEALKELGLRNSQIPGEGLLYKVYDRFGENPLGMALARAAAFAVRGWPVDRLRAAGRVAADLLMENVAGYAPGLLAEHKKSGHILVLATTTPYDLVKPLADRLGIDEVVATLVSRAAVRSIPEGSKAASSGGLASCPPCASGPTGEVSTSPRVTPTQTALTTYRC